MAIVVQTTKAGEKRYRVAYRLADGTQRSKTFRRRRDAEQFERTVQTAKDAGTLTDPQSARVLIGAYGREFIATRRLADRTRELYSHLWAVQVEPTFGSTRLDRLTPADVRRWYSELHGRVPIAAAKSYRLLRQVVGQAVDDRLIARNVVDIPGGGVERSPERPILEPETVVALAAAAHELLRPAVLLCGFGPGVRLGEARGLRVRDLDVERSTLTVADAIDARGRRIAPKSKAAERTERIPASLVQVLVEHVERTGRTGDQPLLPGPRGGVMSLSWHAAEWKATKQRARIDPSVHWHDLRHAAAVLQAEHGATVADLMAALGHSTPAAALRYQHVVERRRAETAERIDGRIGGLLTPR